jgi:predicted nucleic acid-binding protein
MKLYLDANVWIDYLDRNREDHRKAARLFRLAEKRKHVIIVSELHIYETRVHGYYRAFEKEKNRLWKAGLCRGFKVLEEDKENAKKLDIAANRGKADCLHVLTAKRAGAILVSGDSDWDEIAGLLGMKNFGYDEFFRYF